MPDHIVIVNSTPIIALREIGLLDVLKELACFKNGRFL